MYRLLVLAMTLIAFGPIDATLTVSKHYPDAKYDGVRALQANTGVLSNDTTAITADSTALSPSVVDTGSSTASATTSTTSTTSDSAETPTTPSTTGGSTSGASTTTATAETPIMEVPTTFVPSTGGSTSELASEDEVDTAVSTGSSASVDTSGTTSDGDVSNSIDATSTSSARTSSASASSQPATTKPTRTSSSRVNIRSTDTSLDATSGSSTSRSTSSSGSFSTENIAADGGENSTDTSPATEVDGISRGAIVGIVVTGLVAGIVLVGFIFGRHRSDDERDGSSLACNQRRSNVYWGQTSPIHRQRHTDSHPGSQDVARTSLWNDDVIVSRRIPREKLQLEQLLSRGAFGEVYLGVFNRKQVAVKMLLPQTRGDVTQVNEFLAEAKLTATMEHPHIVSFVGIAWDSLSDVCVVLEYMSGGDLRSLLNNYEATRHPVGFNRQKVTIALHVCHALAYLHSLAPAVIHRDLKSRNILLSSTMEAKLTDFGISRERLDRTMTAGVGTSLWMAPEVMMGNKYDDKADIFSFGVVLSELDVHTLPYSRAGANGSSGQVACAVILQKVATGTLSVDFSQHGPSSMAQLGRACVSVNPNERPAAAEILYRLQTVLSRELPQ